MLDLIARDFDVSGGPYSKKSINWKNVALTARQHPDLDPNELANVTGDFVFNVASGTTKIQVNEPLEVLDLGTGFMDDQKMCVRKDDGCLPDYAISSRFYRTI